MFSFGAATPASGFSFGGQPPPVSTSGPALPPTPQLAFAFGQVAPPAAPPPAPAPAAAPQPAPAAAAAAPPPPAPTAAPDADPPPPIASDATVQDVLAHWDRELASAAAAFGAQAEQVVTWDAALRRQYAALSRATEDVHELRLGQKRLENTLDAIEGHQRIMDDTMVRVEAEVDALLGAAGGGAGGRGADPAARADGEVKRAEAYAAAQDVDALLARADGALRAVVARVNAEFERSREDPLETVRGILDDQMAAMAAVDREAAALLAEARGVAAQLGELAR